MRKLYFLILISILAVYAGIASAAEVPEVTVSCNGTYMDTGELISQTADQIIILDLFNNAEYYNAHICKAVETGKLIPV